MAYNWRQWLTAKNRGAAIISVAAMVAVGVGVYVGSDSYVPGPRPSTGATTLLWLYAPRDMGRLPARADWCAGSNHCWLAQETAGATQLADATGGWTLDASGTPRAGVVTSLPVEDATGWVDFTTELSTHTDGQSAAGTGSWWRAAQTQSATNLVSVSAIIMPVYRQATARVLYSHRATADGTGYEVGLATDGTLYATVENSGATTKTVKTAATWDDGAWHAVTWVLDGRSANAGRIYVDGADATAAGKDLATTGSWATTGPARVGADEDGVNIWPGGIARLRVTVGAVDVAATYSGTLWGFDPQAAAVVTAGDIAWAQSSGSSRCYAQSATTALCVRGDKPAPVWSSSLVGGRKMAWAVDPQTITRTTYSVAVNTSAGWTKGANATVTPYSVVAPNGAKQASALHLYYSAGGVYQSAKTGFTAGAALYPRVWIKCSSGTVTIRNTTAAAEGQWSVACATVAGAWTLLHGGHAAVTVDNTWVASATGTAALYFSTPASQTTDVDVWLPTLSESAALMVVQTTATAITIGAPTWTVDNQPAAYYSGSGGKITLYGSWGAGGCLDVYSPGDGGGRQFFDGAHWSIANSDATPIGVANLVPSGVDLLSFRWNSSAALSGGIYAEVLRDGAAATWDTTPLAAWTGESPTAIHLSDYNGTACRAQVQSVQIWDRP